MIASIGDEVLFHINRKWVPAEVTATWAADNVTVLHQEGLTVAQHGAHVHGWLTYEEAARYARDHAPA